MEHEGNVARATPEVEASTVRRAVLAAGMGNVIEFFDNTIYGYLAATLAIVFFPSDNPTVSLLSAFGTFALAYLVRPVGGLVFGALGDRIGRQMTLVTVIMIMAGATFCIGLLPGYAAIGVWAPVLLIVLRVFQGLSFGGEVGGATSFIAEYASNERRGFITGFQSISASVGAILGGAFVAILATVLSPETMESWGWRVAFLAGGPIGLLGLYIRLRLEDTPEFRALRRAGEVSRSPIRETLVNNFKPVVLCAGVAVAFGAGVYTFWVYNTSYLTQSLGLGLAEVFWAGTVAYATGIVATLIAAPLSDRIGRKPVLAAAALGYLLLPLPIYLLLSQGSLGNVFLGQAAFGALHGAYSGVAYAVMVELFPTTVRYTGFGVGYNVSLSLFGVTAPLFATSLVAATGNEFAPAFYVMLAALVSLVTVAFLKETAGTELPKTTVHDDGALVGSERA